MDEFSTLDHLGIPSTPPPSIHPPPSPSRLPQPTSLCTFSDTIFPSCPPLHPPAPHPTAPTQSNSPQFVFCLVPFAIPYRRSLPGTCNRVLFVSAELRRQPAQHCEKLAHFTTVPPACARRISHRTNSFCLPLIGDDTHVLPGRLPPSRCHAALWHSSARCSPVYVCVCARASPCSPRGAD